MILFCIRGHPYKLFPHYSRIDARKLFLNVLPSYGIVYQPNQNTSVLSLFSVVLFIVLILVVLPHLVFKVPANAYLPWHFFVNRLNLIFLTVFSYFAYEENIYIYN